jgi:glycosyltransferase involved in cell wall biosynthesis
MSSVLFVTTVPITLEAFLLPFADRFRAQGWHVDALANGATSDDRLEGRFDRRFDVAWSRDPLAPSNVLGAARRVREVVAAGAYDIVHVHTPIAAFVTRFALRSQRGSAGGPLVIYTAHGFHFYRGGSAATNFAYRTLERTAARWTDYLVTVNAEDFEAARAMRGISADRVRLIPGIGVDCERFTPGAVCGVEAADVRAQLGGGVGRSERFLVTMVGELAPVKRHVLAFEALTRVRDPRVHLAVVGDGPLAAELRDRVERMGLADRVTFAGYRRDVPAVLAASDVLLLTSEREGLNRSMLEAMASGVPVIGTDTRGIADVVDSDVGWIVGHDDAAELATTIDAAAADPAEVTRCGARARERACARYSEDTIVRAYEELYREALAHRL